MHTHSAMIAALLLLASGPAMAAGCDGLGLDGTIRSHRGESAVTIDFDAHSARFGEEADGRTFAVRHETCTGDSISFDLQGKTADVGTCMLYLDGSRALGDCRVNGRRDIAISAIVERSPGETTGAVLPPGETPQGD